MKQLKLIAFAAVLALSSSFAFGQAAPAAGSAAPPAAAPAASSDPSDPTTANANVDCKLEDGSKKTVTAKAAGKNAVAIAKCGEDPKPVVRRPAAPPANTANAETVKRLAEELAGLRAKAAECDGTKSYHIFQLPDGNIRRVCKGENDEVYSAPTVAARVVNPAIVHGAQGRVSVSAPASASAGGTATGARFLAFCEAKFNNGVAQDHVPANSDSAADIRAACDVWAKAQAEKRGITRAANVNNNHGASIFAPAK
jgi:hypothetical protein